MIQLNRSLQAWNTSAFKEILKQEVEQIDAELLPLQQGLSQGNYVADAEFSVMIISVREEVASIRVKMGIFYSGIIAGCSCADDPTPVVEHTEYCQVQLDIDKQTAEARVTLLPE